jgi:hypothetical protein
MAQPHLNTEASESDHTQLLELYKGICDNIRVTDETSFKLLGTVPIAAGIGSSALTILEKSKLPSDTYTGLAVLGLSVFGALITYGLFRWELRNIQKCKWLISRAAMLERKLFSHCINQPQFDGIASEKDLGASKLNSISLSSTWKFPWGKTEAEKLIYWAAIGTWFVPMVVGLHRVL